MTLDCFNRRRTKRRSQGSFLFLFSRSTGENHGAFSVFRAFHALTVFCIPPSLPCKGRWPSNARRRGERASDGCSQDVLCVLRPPIFLFVLPKRKIAPRPVEERKGRQRAEPVYRDRAGHRDHRTWYESGYNRGIAWQNQFRAEPLRLALPWEQV